MIKFELRRNLIYPFQYMIWNLIRRLLTMFISYRFDFKDSLEYTPIMFLGEFFAGGIIYLYEKKVMMKKKETKDQYFMSIKLIKFEEDATDYFIPADKKIKIIFLIFFAAFFDCLDFLIESVAIAKFKRVSASLCMRLYGFATIAASFTYVHTLKLPVYKHHKFSLSIIGICLIIVIVSEYLFQDIDLGMSYLRLTMAIICTIISKGLISVEDSIEKYLFEYDYMDPFVVLIYEGLFGFLLTFFLFFLKEYFDDFIKVYKKCYDSPWNFTLFIFLLILYMVLSGLKNIFKVVTIKIYSPVAKMLTDYFINPLYFFYNMAVLKDFQRHGNTDWFYLILNFVLAIIVSFFGCVYNEFIILFCCGLGHDTHYLITKRSEENLQMELANVNDSFDTHNLENSLDKFKVDSVSENSLIE